MDATTIVAVSLIVDGLAFAAVLHARRVVGQTVARVARAEESEKRTALIADAHKDRATFWRERAAEARGDYTDERDAHADTRAEHTAFLKAIAPEYIVQRANAVLGGETLDAEAEVETPSVTEADRRATAARRKEAERERAIRSEGYQPVVVGDSGAEPPHRLDATSYDDADG